MSRVVDSWWYTTAGGHCVGIVKVVNDTTKEIKFRIGLADGFNQMIDQERIKTHGARFFPEAIK